MRRWFQSEALAAGARQQSSAASAQQFLPKSTASCPSCRGELDWDALALQARKSNMPLDIALAKDNVSFNRKLDENTNPHGGAQTARESRYLTGRQSGLGWRRTAHPAPRRPSAAEREAEALPGFSSLVMATPMM